MHNTGWSPKQKKKNVDRLAAFIILTHFLDFRKYNPDHTMHGSAPTGSLD
jgi:RNase H-fold protein (predicted Holliday junction resolvase)